MDWTSRLLDPQVLPLMIPVVALMVGALAVLVGGITKILKMLMNHRERMAKIAHGIDPDYSPSPGDAGPR